MTLDREYSRCLFRCICISLFSS